METRRSTISLLGFFSFPFFFLFSHYHFTSAFDLVGNVCIMDFLD